MTSLHTLAKRYRRRFGLQLKGLRVLTEAATGPFAATAPLAALAGAEVWAVAKSNRFGSRRAMITQTRSLARRLGVERRIHFVSSIRSAPIFKIDIVTNSGNVRPIRGAWLKQLPKTSVVSLMVEPWEVRTKDVDVRALKHLGIATAGPNERGKKINVFSFLPALIRKAAGKKLKARTRVLSCSGKEFAPYVRQAIGQGRGRLVKNPSEAQFVIVALGPNGKVSPKILQKVPKGATVLQMWGDADRTPRLNWLPIQNPRKGHMGFLLSDLGAEPAIRLAAGGLKVGELLARARQRGHSAKSSITLTVRSGYAQASQTSPAKKVS